MAGGAKKESCRNFQRGSCTYGARCKFLHSTPLPQQQQQQQSKPNNPFGFGSQQQQQSSNPFGFGTQQQKQQQQQSSNPFGFGIQAGHSQQTPFNNNNNTASKPNQHKPFENKWSRFSQTNNGASQVSRQPDTQPASAIHKCTDPDTCKRLMIEDFEHERPLWKLTCYGHNKSAPCDIVGDMSCEELRAAAYSDASSGLSLQSIVERERSFVNAKLQEFESLLRNPYVPKDSFRTTQISFPGVGGTSQLPTTPNNNPPSVSSFTQLGGSLNGGFGMTPGTYAFGQQVSTQSPSQTHSGFGMNTLQFGNTGAFGFQNSNQQLGNLVGGSAANLEQKTSLFPLASSQIAISGSIQSPLFPTAPNSASTAVKSEPRENEAAYNAIWQVEWKRGEVPEEAPPDKYISSI